MRSFPNQAIVGESIVNLFSDGVISKSALFDFTFANTTNDTDIVSFPVSTRSYTASDYSDKTGYWSVVESKIAGGEVLANSKLASDLVVKGTVHLSKETGMVHFVFLDQTYKSLRWLFSNQLSWNGNLDKVFQLLRGQPLRNSVDMVALFRTHGFKSIQVSGTIYNDTYSMKSRYAAGWTCFTFQAAGGYTIEIDRSEFDYGLMGVTLSSQWGGTMNHCIIGATGYARDEYINFNTYFTPTNTNSYYDIWNAGYNGAGAVWTDVDQLAMKQSTQAEFYANLSRLRAILSESGITTYTYGYANTVAYRNNPLNENIAIVDKDVLLNPIGSIPLVVFTSSLDALDEGLIVESGVEVAGSTAKVTTVKWPVEYITSAHWLKRYVDESLTDKQEIVDYMTAHPTAIVLHRKYGSPIGAIKLLESTNLYADAVKAGFDLYSQSFTTGMTFKQASNRANKNIETTTSFAVVRDSILGQILMPLSIDDIKKATWSVLVDRYVTADIGGMTYNYDMDDAEQRETAEFVLLLKTPQWSSTELTFCAKYLDSTTLASWRLTYVGSTEQITADAYDLNPYAGGPFGVRWGSKAPARDSDFRQDFFNWTTSVDEFRRLSQAALLFWNSRSYDVGTN